MKGKITTGRGQAGLHRYIFKEEKGAELIDGSTSLNLFLPHIAAVRATRPDVKQSAIHISLSHDPADPRKLTADDWRAAWSIARLEMEMDDLEYMVARHGDTDHDHTHGEFCKIKADGSIWNDSHSARRLHRACEKIERELGLKLTATVEQHRTTRSTGAATRPMSDGALRQFERTGKVGNKTKEAISRRKRNEQQTENRTAHQQAGRDDGILVESGTPNPAKNAGTRKANRRPAETHRGAGIPPNRNPQPAPVILEAEGWLSSANRAAEPPTLSGRLEARPTPGAEGALDLHWKGRELPTFRYLPSSGELQLLARPDKKNVEALLDASAAMRPPLRVFGSIEFQHEVCRAARLRGLAVEPENEKIRFEHQLEIRRQEIRLADERAERERAAELARRAEFRHDQKERDSHKNSNSPRPPAPNPHI